MERLLLLAGMATPALGIVMFATVEFLTPSHDMISDLPSQFGMTGAAYSGAFNDSLLAIALTCLLCVPAFVTGLVRNGASAPLSGLAALSMALAAVYLAMVALFPVPSPLHGGYHLNVAGHVLPVIGAIALRSTGGNLYRQWLLVTISIVTSIACMGFKLYNIATSGSCFFGLQVELLALAYFVSISIICHAALPARTRHQIVAVRFMYPGRIERCFRREA